MVLISLKDYAENNNVTYEAVRQQVVRYADELGDHVVKKGRQQFLDEEAVAFLDEKRKKNPVTVIQMNKDEEIEALRREKEGLLLKIAEQADKISKLSEWKADNAVLIAKADASVVLLEEKTQALEVLQKDYNDEKERADQYFRENLELKQKLENEQKKTWLDKLFKR